MYLQKLKVTLEADKRTLEQEAVLVKKPMQAKDERPETSEVHYANLISYRKLGAMYPFVHVHSLFIKTYRQPMGTIEAR